MKIKKCTNEEVEYLTIKYSEGYPVENIAVDLDISASSILGNAKYLSIKRGHKFYR